MKKLLLIALLLTAVNASALTLAKGNFTIVANNKYGGALTYLTYKGVQYVDAYDHGRELQSAVSFNGLGECLNPTQGGSEVVGTYQVTSVQKSLYAFLNTIYSGSQMGYWLNPGRYYPQGCGEYPAVTKPTYTTTASNILLNSAYTLGYSNFTNVLVHDVTFNINEAYTKATFEFSTLYLPPSFSKAIFFDRSTGASADANGYNREQTYPTIVYTPDGLNAVGIYSPKLPQTQYGSGYGYWGFPIDGVYKMNAVWRATNLLANSTYKFQTFYVFGTLTEVKSTLQAL